MTGEERAVAAIVPSGDNEPAAPLSDTPVTWVDLTPDERRSAIRAMDGNGREMLPTPGDAPHRTCGRCEQGKPETTEHFYRRKDGTWHSWCRDCSREYQSAYRDAESERLRSTRREREQLQRLNRARRLLEKHGYTVTEPEGQR